MHFLLYRAAAIVVFAIALAASATSQVLPATCPAPPGVKLWSVPGNWPGSQLPGPTTDVLIPAGQTWWFDVGTPAAPARIKSLTVEGELAFACGPRGLETNYIKVHGAGRLLVGSPGSPYPDRVLIRLTHDPAVTNLGNDLDGGEVYDQALVVENGGELVLSGRVRGPSWVRLAATAEQGDQQIQLDASPAWRVGNEIVIASTDYDFDQDEVRTITAISGNLVTLDSSLDHRHWGQSEGPYANNMMLDQRAEVGLLSRSICVEGTPFTIGNRTYGGHAMFRLGPNDVGAPPKVDVRWAEFRDLGREGSLGRYALHVHRTGLLATGKFLHCSVHRSLNRVISLHGAEGVEVRGCVAYDHIGHGFYFEDVLARSNVMVENLGLHTIPTEAGVTPLQEHDVDPSTYWLINPDNTVEDNVAAGSHSFGFWLETTTQDPTHPRFDGNVAHSNGVAGIFQDTRPRPIGATVSGLSAYKNRRHGIWWRTYGEVTLSGLAVADNRGGLYIASEGIQHTEDFSLVHLVDSLIVGESSNTGEVDPAKCHEVAHGRSLPQTSPFEQSGIEWGALIGLEMYDGELDIRDCHFADFADAADAYGGGGGCPATNFVREAGALGNVYYHNHWAVLPTNRVSGLTFSNADAVFLRTPVGYTIPDNGIANTVFIDLDGCVTGVPLSYVYPLNVFFYLPGSNPTVVPAWNAAHHAIYPGPDEYLFGLAQWEFLDPQGLLADFVITSVTRNLSFHVGDARFNEPENFLPTNAVVDDYYWLTGGASVASWPTTFTFRWSGTEANRFIGLGIPYSSSTAVVRFNGLIVPMLNAANWLNDLLNATSDAWYLDDANDVLYLKAFTKGPATGVLDGTQIRVDVTP